MRYSPELRAKMHDTVHIGTTERMGQLEMTNRVGPSLIPKPGADGRVWLQIDNTQAVAAVNKGYSPNPQIDAIARALHDLAAEWNLELVATHIHSTLNGKADGLSRPDKPDKPTSADYAVTPPIRREIERRLGAAHTTEAFADGLGRNAQCSARHWLRNSFFNVTRSGHDWFINPDFAKPQELVDHPSNLRHETFNATVIWPRIGSTKETAA